jgi:endonuclease/exonuclease/phosphatase family metal-dependent hydrolase
MPASPQFKTKRTAKLLARSLEQSGMLAWSRRSESRNISVAPMVNAHSVHQAVSNDGAEPLKLLTFNIQVGIKTTKYRQYVTKGWKHVFPHESRIVNLRRIADLVKDYDLVALQEIDSGSLRSGFINQVEYIADRAQFPYWYTQLNRDLGPFAQQGNGVLSRITPVDVEDHKLPGVIPGRGAILLRLPYGDETVSLVMLHLSLGERSRQLQLEYVRGLIETEEHVVVMGDMNSHLSQLLFDSPLAETNLVPADQVLPTYPAWRPSQALDHVLVSPGLSIDEYEVLDCRLSDHRPIAVTVKLDETVSARQ